MSVAEEVSSVYHRWGELGLWERLCATAVETSTHYRARSRLQSAIQPMSVRWLVMTSNRLPELQQPKASAQCPFCHDSCSCWCDERVGSSAWGGDMDALHWSVKTSPATRALLDFSASRILKSLKGCKGCNQNWRCVLCLNSLNFQRGQARTWQCILPA